MSESVEINDMLGYVVEQNLLGFIVTDLTGSILYVNPRMSEITGYARTELLGQNPRIFGGGKTPKRVYEEIWATILSGSIWHGEMLNRRKNGELYRQISRIAPVFSHDGRITHLTGTCEVEDLVPRRVLANHVVYSDPITRLPMRESLLRRIGTAIARAQGDGTRFSLLYVDIDRFKQAGAYLGPVLADQLLLEFSRRLSGSVRSGDYVARLDSDEFAVLLEGASRDGDVVEVVGRIRTLLAAPFVINDKSIALTVSIGIAVYPDHASDADSLIRAADAATFEISREGGDGYGFHSPDLYRESVGRFDLSQALLSALASEQIELHYQPAVSLVSGEIVGVEALLRWQHPERGTVSPGVFVPLAEESGLCTRLGEWVLQRACRQLKEWQDARLPPIRMSVNLSARHFAQPDLAEKVAHAIHINDIDPKYLELELTESSVMFDVQRSGETFARLKRLGVTIALDDFGTGYSSLSYLSRFPIDTLKIDRTFVQDITRNPVNASIVCATIAMAHKLCKTVIAEGVETESQMRFLRRHDCDQIQGFHFSKPLVPQEVAALMSSGRKLAFGNEPAIKEQLLLVVDDEPSVLSALRRLFRREGYRVLTASSGPEALDVLAANQIQVIVSDQRMPGMSGSQLLQHVKELYPETVRIVLSGYSEVSTVAEAINQGAIWKYFSKPWDDKELIHEIWQAFRRAPGMATDASQPCSH